MTKYIKDIYAAIITMACVALIISLALIHDTCISCKKELECTKKDLDISRQDTEKYLNLYSSYFAKNWLRKRQKSDEEMTNLSEPPQHIVEAPKTLKHENAPTHILGEGQF